MIGIYKITSPTGKIYIGQTKNFENRLYRYKLLLCKKQPRLYASLKKYGFENHKIGLIEKCDILSLDSIERHYQDFFNVTGKNGLNCDLVNSENAPKVRSKETRDKISKGMMGKANFLGKKHTEANRIEISNRQKGRIVSETTRQKLRDHNLGNNPSEETRKKLSENSGVIRTVLDLNTGIF